MASPCMGNHGGLAFLYLKHELPLHDDDNSSPTARQQFDEVHEQMCPLSGA